MADRVVVSPIYIFCITWVASTSGINTYMTFSMYFIDEMADAKHRFIIFSAAANISSRVGTCFL
jgi:hypothetical protein